MQLTVPLGPVTLLSTSHMVPFEPLHLEETFFSGRSRLSPPQEGQGHVHPCSVCVGTHTLTWSTCTAGATEHAHLYFLLTWFPASVQDGLTAVAGLGQRV